MEEIVGAIIGLIVGAGLFRFLDWFFDYLAYVGGFAGMWRDFQYHRKIKKGK